MATAGKIERAFTHAAGAKGVVLGCPAGVYATGEVLKRPDMGSKKISRELKRMSKSDFDGRYGV